MTALCGVVVASCFTWRMSHRDDFLAWVNSQLRDAEIAVYNGDATARRAIWSQTEPVTLFGASQSAVGRTQVDEAFGFLERPYSDCKSYTFHILAAEVIGDMAYTVGYEHTQATINGEPRTYTLRATQIYRREGGDWKVVHRHGDAPPDQA
jgi:ketosteroid isomerase-like protein